MRFVFIDYVCVTLRYFLQSIVIIINYNLNRSNFSGNVADM